MTGLAGITFYNSVDGCWYELKPTLQNEKWITVHPNKENPEDYRRLKVEDGETSKEAVERKFGKDDKKADEDKSEYTAKIEKFKKEKKKLVDDYDKEFNSFYEYTKKIREEARNLTNQEVGEKNATNFSSWNVKFTNNVEKIQEKEGYEERKKENEGKKEKLYENIRLLQKEIAKETYYPQTLAGQKRGKSMTHEEADKGHTNPFYKMATKAYTENCQTCVVAYEARRRGYDVFAGGLVNGNKSDILSASAKDAWIDRKTGDIAKPDEEFWDKKNYKEIKDLLDKKVEKGQRYNISFLWKNRSSNNGHVISVEKDEDGLLLYDPQSDEIRRGKDISDYLRRIRTGKSFEFYRVDDKSFNPEFMDDILKGE